MNDDIEDQDLCRALDRLPRDIQPPHDLWSDIAKRLAPRRRHRYWPVAAAIALVALGAIAGSILLTRPTTNQTVAIAPVPVAQQSAPVAMPQTARAQTLAASVRNATKLDPQTRAVLLRNLAIIEHSLDNIQRALRNNPNSAGLQNMLYQMYRNEAALMSAAQRVQLQNSTGMAL